MGHWNYRIINFGSHIALHEVHYDDDGNPRAYTTNPASFVADLDEGVEGIAAALDMARCDANLSWLTPSDFPDAKEE